MELTGRLTANAKVNELKDGRKVVNFSIAINESYKSKNTDEWKRLTTYVNCSWWRSDAIARHLVKGALVEVQGRISVSAWMNSKGEPKGSLDFHANSIKLHGKGNAEAIDAAPAHATSPVDDLPF